MTTDASPADIESIIAENEQRTARLKALHDPFTGKDAPLERTPLKIPDFIIPEQWVPLEMAKSKLVKRISRAGSISSFIERHLRNELASGTSRQTLFDETCKALIDLRNKTDFPFWAYTLVKIKPKEGGEMIPFKMNYPQILLFLEYESCRLSGTPVREIICKARQWGGSTLTQIYMAWIQLCHKKAWYSTIVAQTKTTAARILAMYEKLIQNYPADAIDGHLPGGLSLSQYAKGSLNDYTVKDDSGERVNDITIQIGSVVEPDNIRGGDVAMIHYSEVGVWKDTPGRRPEDLIRSISGGLLYRPYTMEVMESTAKGQGNYFHREYVRAKTGRSNRRAFFIPWFYILNDTVPLGHAEKREIAEWLLKCRSLGLLQPDGFPDEGRYYWRLWELGATLEGIEWYRITRKGLESHADMASEAPSDDIEAFQGTGSMAFDIYSIDEMRKDTSADFITGDVISLTGSSSGKECLKSLKFRSIPSSATVKGGCLMVWKRPETDIEATDRYLVVVDIGGRSNKADYSVITVFDRFMMSMGGKPEVAAEWRGHTGHAELAWKSAQIAEWYCHAKLVVESNTLETKDKNRDNDGNPVEYILDLVAEAYDNLYARDDPSENVGMQKRRTKWGFHTNSATKPAIISHMSDCIEARAWIEHSSVACDEMSYYQKDGQQYEAAPGQHDDTVMTRAIGLWICFRKMDIPKLVEKRSPAQTEKKVYTEATI